MINSELTFMNALGIAVFRFRNNEVESLERSLTQPSLPDLGETSTRLRRDFDELSRVAQSSRSVESLNRAAGRPVRNGARASEACGDGIFE